MTKLSTPLWIIGFLCLNPSSSFATVTKTVFKEGSLEGVRYDVKVDGLLFGASRMSTRTRPLQTVRLKSVAPYEATLYRPGSPKLPVVRFLVQGEVSVEADVASAYDRKLEAGTFIEPSLESVVKLPGQKYKLHFDPKSYNSDELLPRLPYSIEAAGSIDGSPQKLVTLYPIAYQAKSGQWRFIQKFSVTAKRPMKAKRLGSPVFAFVVGAKFAGSPSLAAYAELKKKQGYTVQTGVMGKDFNSPETIRAWLKGLLAQGLKYAILVGDVEDVPAYNSQIISGVTDHYYRAIDTDDYRTDINGPDLALGRVSVTSEAQLKLVVDKFTRYQTMRIRKPMAGDWHKQLSFVATDDQYQVAEGTHQYVISNYTKKGYTGSFPNAVTAQGGDQLYAITHHAGTNDLLKAFSEGRALIDYSGHGSSTSWAGPGFDPSDIAQIANDEALPFVIGNACNTGEFTVSEAFGESWLRSNKALAYWGSMDSTYWDEDDILEKKMADGIFQYGQLKLGDFTSYALASLWNHYGGDGKSAYYWETYVLFGDPSIDLRLK